MRRKDVVLERDAITSALITDDPGLWIRGVRVHGVRLPSRLALGVWRSSGGRDFILARRGRPAVVLDFHVTEDGSEAPLAGASGEAEPGPEFDEFARVVLTTRHAAELIRALRIEDSDAVFSAGAD